MPNRTLWPGLGPRPVLFAGLVHFLGFAIALLATPAGAAGEAVHRYGLAMHGEPALSATFKHLPYVNPDAPQGGRVVNGVLGGFDSLNPFIVRGTPPTGIIASNVVESLMARSFDEPFTLYGLLAESVAVPEDRSFVEFRLNAAARFSDGQPVTAEDVLFSWDLLKTRGRPNHRTYYSKVAKAEAVDSRTVRFDLAGANDRELPLILGLMPILPKHATDPQTFESGGLKPLIGSGPYVITNVDVGRSLTLTRNKEYWGRDLPVTRGWGNYDEIRYDYYRDANTMLEAFRKGLYDVRPETDPSRWLSGYDGPALRDGRIVRDEIESRWPKPISAFVFNTRRDLFRDVRVREALGLLFDFEWANANFFHGAYARTGSYFQGSELSALARPADAAERALLSPFPLAVRGDVLEGRYAPPKSDGSGRDRQNLRAALDLFRASGWELKNGALKNAEGTPFRFEILVRSREQERIALGYARDAARAGVKVDVRLVDAVQFETQLMGYDFDVTQYVWDNSLSPGNEQSFYWGSAGRETKGTRNYMGAADPAIDAMIAAIVQARTRPELVTAARALDRILISGFYVIPLYHLPKRWIARWSHIGRPQITPLYGPVPETWWRGAGP